jgi:C-terminal processing protease CtpA/Prc
MIGDTTGRLLSRPHTMRKLCIVVLVVVALFAVLLVVFHQRHHAQQSVVSINGERFHFIGAINGVVLTITNNILEIQYVVRDSLATKAGLHPGLIIQQIDGTNTVGKPLRECRLMTFGPIGSEVHFVVVGTAKNETNIVEVLRQRALMRDAH